MIRIRETRSQVGLSAGERQENVKGVFEVDMAKVNGKIVLLMANVSTTGAALSSAAEALYASNACDVYAITVAHALPHHGLKIV